MSALRSVSFSLMAMMFAAVPGCSRLTPATSSRQGDSGRAEVPSSFDQAVDNIESQAMYARSGFWREHSMELRTRGRELKSEEDQVRLLMGALRAAGDLHAFVVPSSLVVSADDEVRKQSAPAFVPIGPSAGILAIPEFASSDSAEANAYADKVVDATRQAIAHSECGVIVDLRTNGGGNMWPMLLGLSPILGSEPYGNFEKSKVLEPWRVKDSKVKLSHNAGGVELPVTSPVAVLIDDVTASSGEAVAIAFKGRANTKFFGTPTRGLTTATQRVRVTDQYLMFVSVSNMADRAGRLYPSGVDPDVLVGEEGVVSGRDEALERASLWLASSCVKS